MDACACRHSTITIQGVLGALLTSSIFLGAPSCLDPLVSFDWLNSCLVLTSPI